MTATGVRSSANPFNSTMNIPPSQNTAPVHEFRCLFTHDIRRKNAKRWHDGTLRFHTFNKRVMVYDIPDKNFIGDTYLKEGHVLDEGDEVALERGGMLVQVGERTGGEATDLTPLLSREERRRESAQTSRLGSMGARTRRPQAATSAVRAQLTPRSSNTLSRTSMTGIGRAQVSAQSPFELRNSVASERVLEEDRPSKRRRNDENHVPLWEVLRTSKIAKPGSTATKPFNAPLGGVIPPSRTKASSKKAKDDGQARLKVKELIDITSSIDDPGTNDRQQTTSAGPYRPTSGASPLILQSGLNEGMSRAPAKSVNRHSEKSVCIDIEPAISNRPVEASVVQLQPQKSRYRNSSVDRLAQQTNRDHTSNQPSRNEHDAAQHLQNTSAAPQLMSLQPNIAPMDKPSAPFEDISQLTQASKHPPTKKVHSEPQKVLRIARKKPRNMLLCQEVPVKKASSNHPVTSEDDKLSAEGKRTGKPKTKSEERAKPIINKSETKCTEKPPKVMNSSPPAFSTPFESLPKMQLPATLQNQRQYLTAGEAPPAALAVPKDSDTSTKQPLYRNEQQSPKPNKAFVLQRPAAKEPISIPDAPPARNPATETDTLKREPPTETQYSDLPSLSSAAPEPEPERGPATSGPWTIEAWDLLGWWPQGRSGLPAGVYG